MKKLFIILLTVCGLFLFNSCKASKELVVYTEAGFAPFEYLDGDNIIGVDVDIMNMVGEKLGKKVVFKNVNFNTIVDIVAQGKLGNVGAAGLSINEERLEKVDFSEVYYTANLYVIMKVDSSITVKEMSDSINGVYWSTLGDSYKVGVQTGTTADIFAADYVDEKYITGFESLGVAVEAIGTTIDCVVIDELPAKMLCQGKEYLKCIPLYDVDDTGADVTSYDEYAIAVTKGQTEILNAINEVINELGKDGIQALVNKHLGLE